MPWYLNFEKNPKQCKYLETNRLLNSFIFSGPRKFEQIPKFQSDIS